MVVDRAWPQPAERWWWLAVIALGGWLGCWWRKWDAVAAVALGVSLAGLGGAWHHARWQLFGADEVGTFCTAEPRPACLEAIALSRPRWVPAKSPDPLNAIPGGDRSRLIVRVTRIREQDRWLPASGRALLMVDGHLLGVHYGDRLRIMAQLSAPEPPQNPGEFDFAEHVRVDRQLSHLWADNPDGVTVLEHAGGWSLRRLFDEMRSRGGMLLWRYLERERSGMAAALLLGSREQLDNERNEAYFLSGMIHVLSISGLHVGILAMSLFGVMRLGLVRRGTALIGVALLTLFYAIVIDAEPPAVRATIIVMVACASLYMGRPALGFNSLAAAALVVLAMNPADLFRAGPQLSFLCAAVLAWFGNRRSLPEPEDPLDRLIAETRPWPVRVAKQVGWAVWQGVVLSTWIWIVTLPLVMMRFHISSPVALLLTPLLAIPIAAGLLSGFGILLFGWAVPPVASFCAWLCDRSLWLTDAGVAWASRLPGSHFWVLGPEPWWVASYYVVLALGLALPQFLPRKRWCIAILAGWWAVGFVSPVIGERVNRYREGERLVCTFLSVGHGCAVVMELPGGKTLLYDAGRLGSPVAGTRSISSFLWSKRIKRLDGVVISHADVDHYNALPELLERFTVDTVFLTPTVHADQGAATRILLRAIADADVPLLEIGSGDQLALDDDCTMRVLHPPRSGVGGSDNANSIVLVIEYRGRKILLPGDLESPGIEQVLQLSPIDCHIVLAPHHGSRRSDPPGFSSWSTPDYVVFSGGHGRDVVAVEKAYRQRGAETFNTATDGAIAFTIDRDAIRVKTFIGRPAEAR